MKNNIIKKVFLLLFAFATLVFITGHDIKNALADKTPCQQNCVSATANCGFDYNGEAYCCGKHELRTQ